MGMGHLLGWGIHDLNGWDIWLKWVGHLGLKWVGQLWQRVTVYSLVPRPHPAHARRRGLVSQVQILGPAEVLKPYNC